MTTMSTDQSEDFSSLRVDLHSHTTFSDGKLTPAELIDRAVNFQLDVLAITDHDSVEGCAVARQHISANNLPIRLISGIEISTAWHGFEIHIVGLNVDEKSPALAQLITEQQAAREERAQTMSTKLEKCGFDNVYVQAKALAGNGTLTRAHIARVIQEQAQITKMQSVFDKYIGKGQRAYVKPNWCDIETAVDVIHQAGGSAVIAHPVRYGLSSKWLRRLVVQFKTAGGDGLEIVLPQMNDDQRRNMLKFCDEYELHASMGSDFHYPTRWLDLGRNLRMPESAQPIWQLWR